MSAEARPAHILVIDDEEALRVCVSETLIECQYRISCAANGQEGLELYRKDKPDCIVVDIKMPGISGLDVLAEVTRDDPNIPVIVVSGAGTFDDVVNALRKGARDFITKPFHSMALIQHAVGDALDWRNMREENTRYRLHLEDEVRQRTKELADANARLRKAHDELEKRVAERTAELTTANTSLLAAIETRRQAEEALVRSERLAAVGTLAGGVAHEFNNINTSVLGFSELALHSVDEGSELADFLNRIRRAALRAKSITTNLMTFAGARAGCRRQANLNRIIEEAMGLIAREMETEGILLTKNFFAALPDTILDADQVAQVALNLLTNAKHSLIDRPRKEVTVETGVKDDLIYLRVIDTGCGIPRESLSRIFTPFYTTKGEHAQSGSSQARVRGSGLGLSVSSAIVEKHGGELTVVSEEGVGSSFTVWLPLCKDENAQECEQASGPAQADPAAAKILVLDDETDTHELLRAVLGKTGHQVSCTDNGNEALDWLQHDRYAVALVDLQMAKMDGVSFLAKLKELPPTHRPLPIVITGKFTNAAAEGYADLGVYTTVQKPFELDALVACVKTALVSSRNQKI